MIEMKKSGLLFTVSLTAWLLGGCGIDNKDNNIVGDAQLISMTPLFDINASTMQPTVTALTQKADDPTTVDVNESTPPQPAFGIKGFRMVYKTHNLKGEEINVSGLVTIPVPSQTILAGLAAKHQDYSMSIVSDQHGTIFPDNEAPTTEVIMTHKPSATGTLFSAVAGFITVQPDLIGYGESKTTTHPYFIEKESASPVIDMIKATLAFGTDSNLPLNGQVYLTGYSEGGYVTLAAAKEIEANQPDIHLAGVAPMSGPYDLNLTGMGVVSQDSMARPDFIGGIINSYAKTYDYNLSEILATPYDTILPTLYDAADLTKTKEFIQAQLTNSIADFFVPAFRGDFLTNANNALRVDFVNNSVDDYTPTTPTQLYYCSGDTIIDPRLALAASAKMGVPAIDISPSLDHVPCAQPAYATVAAWFVELRSK